MWKIVNRQKWQPVQFSALYHSTMFKIAPQNHPRFQGMLATAAARQTLLSSSQLEELLLSDTDPYVGEVPEKMLRHFGSRHGALTFLDNLADKSQGLWTRRLLSGIPIVNQLLAYRLQNVGSGSKGKVYRLTIGGKDYAFKVQKSRQSSTIYNEIANGAYFTARNTSDLSKFHISNPQRGWTLMEYIGNKEVLAGRSGQTMREQGYFLSDSISSNYKNGIRIDHGGTAFPAINSVVLSGYFY